MLPILWRVPGLNLPIHSFGLMVALGFLLALYLWGPLLRRFGRDPEGDPIRGQAVATWVLIGTIAGARLMYVGVEAGKYLAADVPPPMEAYLAADDRGAAERELERNHPELVAEARRVTLGYDFLHDPTEIFLIWRGGLVMYGGLFGAMLLGCWSAKKQGLAVWNALDTGLTAGFVGQAVGRVGCLLVGDDHGSRVPEAYEGLPFPITLKIPADLFERHPDSLFARDLAGQVVWATQTWMTLNALFLAALGYWLLKRRRYEGQVALWLILFYAITRSLIESFRGDGVRGLWFDGALSTSQLVSLPVALACAFLLVRLRGHRDADRAGAPGAPESKAGE